MTNEANKLSFYRFIETYFKGKFIKNAVGR